MIKPEDTQSIISPDMKHVISTGDVVMVNLEDKKGGDLTPIVFVKSIQKGNKITHEGLFVYKSKLDEGFDSLAIIPVNKVVREGMVKLKEGEIYSKEEIEEVVYKYL